MKNWTPRSQIYLFLALTFSVTSIFHWKFIFGGGLEQNLHLIIPLMWTPGIIGLICSWLFGHKFKDIGFKRCSWRQLALAYAIPAGAAVGILLLLIIFGIGSFEIPEKSVVKAMLLKAPTVLVVGAVLRALGEEIGWRGFLHSRLIEAKVTYPFLVTGIIWALWHIPVILFADYATSDLPLLSAALFTIGIVAASVFMGWQRQLTGSVWPAALFHGVHNIWIQVIYPAFIKAGPLDPYFGGESGVFLIIIYVSVAVLVWTRNTNQLAPVLIPAN